MKILHTADWHIGQFKGPVENGVNLRSRDTIECLAFMVEKAKEEKPDLVCISGDIFHQEQVGPVRYSDEMVTATRTIEALSSYSKFVVVMRGTPNHDGAGQFCVLSEMLSHNKKVAVVTVPQVIQTPIADIACIPGFDKQEFRAKFPGLSADEENNVWTENISSMVMGLRAQCTGLIPSVLMAHYTVPGCNMESGQTSFFANFEPVIPHEALMTADFDTVLLGHIHRPQRLDGLRNTFYSGAVNAMNFNDEGQERGFWIHELSGNEISDSRFITTPYREFGTITWEQHDVESYLQNGIGYLLEEGIPFAVSDKIIRLQYTCTSDQKKALNIPVLQSDLYECGAFFVADIEAEQTIDITNRGLLKEESDPLLNLKKWLDEKCFKDTDKIVELAEPIISSALSHAPTAEIHGVFRPVSIAVKNYRNYKEEHFDFTDISFCTINGANGAGKSSLFMDAIVDCLFEETREGDNKAWIRGTEDARSGSIEFIFDIGENRFRVVRTRTKSGKPTLNLSRIDGAGDWQNLSKERITDTQTEIQRVLGMDSMTFRSCALIMQDQYGLFLQAKKDERIAILSNLLGLGIYGVMEQDARKLLADAKRTLAAKKEAVRIKSEIISGKGNPEEELAECEKELAECEELADRISNQINLVKERDLVQSDRKALQDKQNEIFLQRAMLQSQIDSANMIIDSCRKFLDNEAVIKQEAKRYAETVAKIQELQKEKIRYESDQRRMLEYNSNFERECAELKRLEEKNRTIEASLEKLFHAEIPELDQKLRALTDARAELQKVRDKKDLHTELVQAANKQHAETQDQISVLRNRLQIIQSDLSACEQQRGFIANSGCLDIQNAGCRFLQKAKTDVERIEQLRKEAESVEESIRQAKDKYSGYVSEAKEKLAEIGYSPEEEKQLSQLISELEIYEREKAEHENRKLEIARLSAEKDSSDKMIASCRERMNTAFSMASELTENVLLLSETVRMLEEATAMADKLRDYEEQEKDLPVFEERRKNAAESIRSKSAELDEARRIAYTLTDELALKDSILAEYAALNLGSISELEKELNTAKDKEKVLNVEKGTLLQKAEDVRNLKSEIEVLKTEITEAALLLDRYEILKQAFSQDGVPHQIIRNIIPHITDTANNILGSMTGGTMGVEFVLERTVKGKDGDKATLDVMINEYGKTTLSYASKSGGEKVKASLAVILALTEIKTTAAGIQLGMLFIDEPPFLDSDGTQAYVDALETIRNRYSDVKIMAITHDEAMKARFSQSVTVIKTTDGSKVIY